MRCRAVPSPEVPAAATAVIAHGKAHHEGLIGCGVAAVQQDVQAVVQVQARGTRQGHRAVGIFKQPERERQLRLFIEAGADPLKELQKRQLIIEWRTDAHSGSKREEDARSHLDPRV